MVGQCWWGKHNFARVACRNIVVRYETLVDLCLPDRSRGAWADIYTFSVHNFRQFAGEPKRTAVRSGCCKRPAADRADDPGARR
jgi:hypothetical protein